MASTHLRFANRCYTDNMLNGIWLAHHDARVHFSQASSLKCLPALPGLPISLLKALQTHSPTR